MQRRHIWALAIASIACAALVSGCASSGGTPPETVEPRDTSEFDAGIVEESLGGEDLGSEQVAGLEAVYFDYDRSVIRDDQKPTLRSNSAAIGNSSAWRTIVVEGHCDERGSEEYNLALGERRANAVKGYLINLGIAGSKLDTVSFGESKSAVQGHDESAWRWNRRAEFRVIR